VEAMTDLVVAVAPITAHSSAEGSSSETTGRRWEVYEKESAAVGLLDIREPLLRARRRRSGRRPCVRGWVVALPQAGLRSWRAAGYRLR
jgi:hypothetical protein